MFVRHAILFVACLAPAALAQPLDATRLDTYATGLFDEGAAEIAAYDAATQRIFFVNADADEVIVLDASDPSDLSLAFTIDATPYGAGVNSVAVSNGVVALAVQADPATDPGAVALFDTDGAFVAALEVGALPDAVAFSPDGETLVVANEGEPNDAYTVDPEGSISIIDLGAGAANATVRTVGLEDFNDGGSRTDEITDQGIRVFGPNASVAQDLEPEFVVVSPDGETAYVSVQENNALAIVNLEAGTLDLLGLGFKNHALAQNALDPSNRDGGIAISTWPVYGMYQPDGLAAYDIEGATYVFTANEGDARDYDGFSEEVRIADLTPDPIAIPDGPFLLDDARLGRLRATDTLGDVDGDGDFETFFAYGARSFSIHDEAGVRVWDSGDDIERQIAALVADGTLPGDAFGATNDENDSFDGRSDDKGPEPEGVVVGEVDGRTFAFVGLERISAVIVYDVSDVTAPTYAGFLINRDFTVDAQLPDGSTNPAVGDLGPEGLVFISPSGSPTGQALLVVSNEVSGTLSVWGLGSGGGTGLEDGASSALLTLSPARPNPARAPRLAFSLAAPADVEVVIVDALGREVGRISRAADAGSAVLDAPVTGLASGVYHARVTATAGATVETQSSSFTLVR
ncbi:choice-of-anchor I family protein [Rubrivirga sp.]|uniref:choice-of-anchor I family protein n=1 Tax=Rubrivirga sp. TaxID=1885344 RepID=UPI003C752F2D